MNREHWHSKEHDREDHRTTVNSSLGEMSADNRRRDQEWQRRKSARMLLPLPVDEKEPISTNRLKSSTNRRGIRDEERDGEGEHLTAVTRFIGGWLMDELREDFTVDKGLRVGLSPLSSLGFRVPVVDVDLRFLNAFSLSCFFWSSSI